MPATAQALVAGYAAGKLAFHLWNTVLIDYMPAGDGWGAVAGDEDADQVEGVGGGDGYEFAAEGELAGGAEGFDGGREGELFADEAVYEAAAPDFAAVFEATEGH